MNTEILNWAIKQFGMVEFEAPTSKDEQFIFKVRADTRTYHVPIDEYTTPDDFILSMKMQDLRILTDELKSLPAKRKFLQGEIRELKKDVIKRMRK